MGNNNDTSMDNVPPIIHPSITMSAPNEDIDIYFGEYELEVGGQSLMINGKIYFQWLPKGSVRFEGILVSASDDFSHLKIFDEEAYLIIEKLRFGQAAILNFSISESTIIEGKIISNSIYGDDTVPVERISFAIPNLRYFNGDPTKYVHKNGTKLLRSRLCFNNEYYSITIDKIIDFEGLQRSLKKKGGYILLYGGEITKVKGNINYSQLQSLNECFATFLTFLNGRRCSPLFFKGIYKGEIIWTDYTSYRVDQYKDVGSWPQANSIEGLNDLWKTFYRLWQESNDQDFISTAIHWYTEANINTGYLEGSLIMGQIALELIYNWLVIEKKNILYGKDSDSISSANKIRLLLSQVQGDGKIPAAFNNLKSYKDNNQEINDGVDIIVQIRNAIVHAQEEKRHKLISIDTMVKYEAQQLALWYIEYSLLYILEFKGKYVNRTSGKKWSGEGEEDSPYIS